MPSMSNCCENCRHFNKAAYPGNPMFGRCEFVLPQLPIWAQRQIAVEFRPMTKDTEYCSTHTSEGGK